MVLSPMGLGRIFDERQAIPFTELSQWAKIGHLPIEVHGQEGTRPWRNGTLDLLDIHGVRGGFDIDKNRTGPHIGDGPRRGNEGHRDRDDFISWAYPTGNQGQVQRTGSRIHPDTVAHPTVAGKRCFKSRHCRPRGKGTLLDHVLYRRVNLIADRRVLVLEIDKWYAMSVSYSQFISPLEQYPSRIASHNGPGSDVMGDDTPSTHRCPFANGHPAEDHSA